jgi:MFS family permease
MNRWLLVAAVAAGLFLAAVDTYAVATVIPAMVTDLDIPLDHLERAGPIVSGFLVGYVAGIPLVGGLSARRGRGIAYLGALGAFVLGSGIVAVAPSLAWVVAGRGLQGLGGGAMVPLAMSLAAALFAGRDRGPALGVVAGIQELGSLAGPAYGAALATAAAGWIGWRAIYWINLPLAALCAGGFVLARRRPVHEEAVVPARRMDWIGATLLAAGLAIFVIALYPADAARSAFGQNVVPLSALAFSVLLLFGWREWRQRDPYLPRELFGERRFGAALLTNFLVGSALVVALVDIPILARVVYGKDELGAAALLGRFMIGIPLGAVIGGLLGAEHRLGPRWTCFGGLVAAAAAFLVMAGWQTDELGRQFLGLPEADLVLALGGIGFGSVVAPLVVSMLAPAQPRDYGVVAGAAVLARTVGMLVGLAALSGIGLHRFYELLRAGPRLNVSPGSPLFNTQSQALAAWVVASLLAEYRQVFQVAAGICFAAGLIALLTLGPSQVQTRDRGRKLPREARWWVTEEDQPDP